MCVLHFISFGTIEQSVSCGEKVAPELACSTLGEREAPAKGTSHLPQLLAKGLGCFVQEAVSLVPLPVYTTNLLHKSAEPFPLPLPNASTLANPSEE